MRVVRAVTKGGLYDDLSVCRSIGDFGIPVFHRPGWRYRPKESSLNQVRDDSISSQGQVVEQSMLNRIGFVVVKEIHHREKER